MADEARRVLIIDDDHFFLKVLSDTFRENGFAVFTASDGVQGVKAFVETVPDVVISDLIMPRLGGVSTCIEVSRRAAELGVDPVVVLLTSMFHEPPHEHEVPEMGAKVHIPKSTKPLDIVIMIEQLLERRESRRGAR